MKTSRFIYMLLALVLTCTGARAQSVNKIYLGSISAVKEKVAYIPLYLENTNTSITAIQLEIEVPNYYMQLNGSVVFDKTRMSDHTANFNNSSSISKLMITSPTNKTIRGNKGVIANLPFYIPSGMQEGETYIVKINKAILADSLGNSVPVDFSQDATVEIKASPDFEVSAVSVSPSSFAPGDGLTFTWTVTNVGTNPTEAGWSNQLYLVSDYNGQSYYVGADYSDQILQPGESVTMTKNVLLSNSIYARGHLSGRVQLTPDSNAGESSAYRTNNIANESASHSLGTTVLFGGFMSVVPEPYDNPYTYNIYVYRYGNTDNPVSFTIEKLKGDDRISLDSTEVTIPTGSASAAFTITVANDDDINEDDEVNIKVSNSTYGEKTYVFRVENNDFPELTLTSSNTDLNEGDTFSLTVRSSRVEPADLEVELGCERPARFRMPSTVTIPQGQQEVTVNVDVVDDSEVSDVVDVKFTATSGRYTNGTCLVVLNDDDMPDLQFTVTPATISEGAGPSAIQCTIERTTKLENKVTVYLSANVDGQIYFPMQSITLNGQQKSATFSIGAIDNDRMEGDRTVNVTASIWISSCGCSASETTGGSVTRQITILDDDGPALSVLPLKSSMLEGSSGNVVRVSRNNDTSSPLTVTLTSNADASLSYVHTAEIPAGSEYVDFVIAVPRNDVADDSQTIVFTASSNGYAKGTNWVLITDQTLADAVITDITLTPNVVLSNGESTATITVANKGYADMPVKTLVNLYVEDEIIKLYTDKALAPGDSTVITHTFNAPATPKTYSIYASVNENGKFLETIKSNNDSKNVNLVVNAAFTVTAQTDKTVYNQNDKVVITGKASGTDFANSKVEIYLLNNSVRDTLSAVTDANGNYRAEWQPVAGQSGHYGVGACYPGENKRTVMSEFDVYGLRRANTVSRQHGNYITCDVYTKDVYSDYIDIYNPGQKPLHNVHVELVGDLEDAVFECNYVGDLAAEDRVNIPFTLTGVKATEGKIEWHTFTARVTTDEGAVLDQTIYYFVHPSYPALIASESEINTTMVKGSSRTFEFMIGNKGKEPTGNITLDLGDITWISAATPKTMPSLDFGKTATVVLTLTPTDDMQLNTPYTGEIVLSCENGGGLRMPFRVEPVSEAIGTLIVDVCDEATYNTAEAPHVQGATISVKHLTTGAVLYTGTSDENGLYNLDINEGYYQIDVTEPSHTSYSNVINVSAERETRVTADISINGISLEMVYEETEIEDEYNIVTTVVYNTDVPAPVVKIEEPDELPFTDMQDGESIMYYARLTNVGLIKALATEYHQPADFMGYTFKPLIEGAHDLLPHETITIPVLVEYHEPAPTSAVPRRKEGLQCVTTTAEIVWNSECGMKTTKHTSTHDIKDGKGCGLATVTLPDGGPGGYSPGPEEPGNADFYLELKFDRTRSHPTETNKKPTSSRSSCDKCTKTVYQMVVTDIVEYFLPVPIVKMKEAWDCASQITTIFDPVNNISDEARKVWKCTKIVIPEIVGHKYDKVISFYDHLVTVVKDCRGRRDDGYSGHARAPRRFEPAESDADTLTYYDAPEDDGMPSWANVYRKKMAVYANYLSAFKEYVQEFFGNEEFYESEPTEMYALIDAFDNAMDHEIMPNFDGFSIYKPSNISDDEFRMFIERMNNTFFDYSPEAQASTNRINIKKLVSAVYMMHFCDSVAEADYGYEGAWDLALAAQEQALEDSKTNQGGVCATISLQMEQTMTMTRQAVRGTLTVQNGHKSVAMTDVKLNFTVLNPEGEVAGTYLMQIAPESLEGFTGDLDLQSGWTLGAEQTGVAKILFIPTKYAAPDSPVQYKFTGTITYIDPFSGLEMTRELTPSTLTVNPSPNLELTYFMQRDIFGDDPLTEDVVEPMVPSQFSLLINNKGNGDATNVCMVTKQPEIISNDKGLQVDFEILSSQLNGGDKVLAFGESVTTDFGTIPANSTTYAQWWLQSELTGHFVGYDVSATHVSSYGNENLSLLDTVTIHELIHSIKIPARKGSGDIVGFVCNDVTDSKDLPDIIYFSDATTEPVDFMWTASITEVSNNKATLTVNPKNFGWTYGYVNDPTAGNRKIEAIRRLSDGAQISLDNFWQTDRTLVDGDTPVYENLIHFVDSVAAEGESYEILFEDRPDIILAVSIYDGIPARDSYAREPVTSVTVNFNKDIVPTTFTTDDITLRYAGQLLDASGITITKVDNKTFTLTLGNLTVGDGYYQLTVQTTDIEDCEGYMGETGKMASWIQVTDGKVNLMTRTEPADAGIVTPGTAPVDYNSEVTLTATANSGYHFKMWRDELSGETFQNAETTVYMNQERRMTAVFTADPHQLIVSYNARRGSISGGGTAIYDHGTKVSLNAQPTEGNLFKGWKIDGTVVETANTYEFTITADTEIEALFEAEPPLENITLDENAAYGYELEEGGWYSVHLRRQLSPDYWNTFSVPFSITEKQVREVFGQGTLITEFESVVGNVMNFVSSKVIEAGTPYLIKPTKIVLLPEFNYKGTIEVKDKPTTVSISGYSFVANYSPYRMLTDGTEFFIGTNGNFYKPSANGASLKGMRAYFKMPFGSMAKLNIDGVVTDIEFIMIDGETMHNPALHGIYSLQGQYLGESTRNLPKGIYIINGRKTVIK